MPWSTPPDFTAGVVVTEAQLDLLSTLLTTGVERPLADVVLAAPAATVDFSSIPATFRGLRVELSARGDHPASITDFLCRFNNVTTVTQYHTVGSYVTAVGLTQVEWAGSLSGVVLGTLPAASATQANEFGGYVFSIPDYAGTTGLKNLICAGGARWGGAGGGSQRRYALHGTWDNTAAVDRLTLFPANGNFAAGSRFTLYGTPGI